MASIYVGSGNELFYHGSGHIKAITSDLVPPHGKVIVAIQFLDDVVFDELAADTSGASRLVNAANSRGDGIAYFGSEVQTRANGLNQSNGSAESEEVEDTVTFPKGTIIYGRWTRVKLNGNYTSGIIVYYGPQ